MGRITGAHGIHGSLKVHSFAETMAPYQEGEEILLDMPESGPAVRTIQWAKSHGRSLLLGLEAVDDRNAAEALVGVSLFIEKKRLPTLEEDAYYWFDLVGLSVYDVQGKLLGRLDEVIPTPGNDVYVVKQIIAGKTREILLPAIGEVIVKVDIAGKTMVVNPPEGL